MYLTYCTFVNLLCIYIKNMLFRFIFVKCVIWLHRGSVVMWGGLWEIWCMGMLPIEVIGSYSRKSDKVCWCWVSNSLRGAGRILSIVHVHLIFEQYVINFMLDHILFHVSKISYWSSYCLTIKILFVLGFFSFALFFQLFVNSV